MYFGKRKRENIKVAFDARHEVKINLGKSLGRDGGASFTSGFTEKLRRIFLVARTAIISILMRHIQSFVHSATTRITCSSIIISNRSLARNVNVPVNVRGLNFAVFPEINQHALRKCEVQSSPGCVSQ